MITDWLNLNVTLPNGHHEVLSVPQISTVLDLKIAAQRVFGQKLLRFVADTNRVLVDPEESVAEAGLKDGDCLTAVVLQPQLAATGVAFALWCLGGHKIVTWGYPLSGGDSSKVQAKLKNVQQIKATNCAFAAIVAGGSVVTWGNPDLGGDSSAVQHQLRNVQQIEAAAFAFAAILSDDGSVEIGRAHV